MKTKVIQVSKRGTRYVNIGTSREKWTSASIIKTQSR